jgi:hypothetical protein
MTAEVTVRAGDGTPVGRVTVAADGRLGVEVLVESGRATVQAVAATMARPSPRRPRAACAGGAPQPGGRIIA